MTMTTSINSLQPVLVSDNDGNKELLPLPELFSKFELLHYFLDEILEDWKRASAPYQAKIDAVPGDSVFSLPAAEAFIKLQPIFLKCLFSYAMFFFATDAAYDLFYSQLNRANEIGRLKVKHKKPPRKSNTIKNLRKIRDLSIVHIGSPKETSEIDKLSAIAWQPMSWRRKSKETWNINNIEFGGFQRIRRAPDGTVLDKSQEITVSSLIDLHNECIQYLESFDEVCAEYLLSLQDHLQV